MHLEIQKRKNLWPGTIIRRTLTSNPAKNYFIVLEQFRRLVHAAMVVRVFLVAQYDDS